MEEWINTIIADLKDWLKRDPQAFWKHVEDLERDYLKGQSEHTLFSLYQNVKEN